MINKINLQLFAQGAGGEDRTEKATPRKRSDARKKGQVLQSREISSAMVLLFVFIALRVFGKSIYTVITYQFLT
jgi:flagellar biosynthetic protein FlhB